MMVFLTGVGDSSRSVRLIYFLNQPASFRSRSVL